MKIDQRPKEWLLKPFTQQQPSLRDTVLLTRPRRIRRHIYKQLTVTQLILFYVLDSYNKVFIFFLEQNTKLYTRLELL